MDYYKAVEESWTCGDGCCYNNDTYLEKNGKRYTRIHEDNGEEHEVDMVFLGNSDIIEFILEREFNIKVSIYMLDWDSENFKDRNYDYLIFDGYSSKGFEDYLYILDRKDYLNDLELKNISPSNIITNFEKKKEDDIYVDLFNKISGNSIDYQFIDLDRDEDY